MTARHVQAPGRWDGLFLSLGFAGVFLAACVWWMLREIEFLLPNDRVSASIWVEDSVSWVLLGKLGAFAVAALLCHGLLGLLAFGLARLTEAAFPGGDVARRGWLIAGWLALLVALVMASNATWHRSSIFAAEESVWLTTWLGLHPVQFALIAAGLAVAMIAGRAWSRPERRWRPWRLLAGFAAAGMMAALPAVSDLLPRAGGAIAADRPHIVVIGIDSLRSDLSVPRLGDARTPHLRAFLAGARRFGDATTPLARTYGSWVSILTGRHPVTTNARYNLMPRRLVREGDTLADALRAAGYRAVYATDEVRFANIDESFGFEQLITPPMGAIDFLLGYAGDLPLVNLIATTRTGGILFPSNHANRAAYVTYEPDSFVRRLDRELEFDGPLFLAVHLTLAHWPYAWTDAPVPGNPSEYRVAYERALPAVDAQFAEVMALLERRGILGNAVVVLLSDHGEALGAEDDSMLRGTGTSREVWDSLWGHGTSVFSPHQYAVLLAFRSYGGAEFPGVPGDYGWPVSLEDLRPTLEEYATRRAPGAVDGISLLPFLSDPAGADVLRGRVRFTETDFNTPSTLAGEYEESGLIDEAAVYYEVEPASGWAQLRADRLPELIRRKQLAAIGADALLARVPDAAGRAQFLFTERRAPAPRRLEGRPDPLRDPEAARLWEALEGRFPGEFPGLARLP